MKNMTYTDITTILKPSSMAAESNVLLPANIKINSVDLDTDALTFRAGDEKTFTNAVKITDGLNVVPGDTSGNLTLSSTHNVNLIDETDAILYSVNIADRSILKTSNKLLKTIFSATLILSIKMTLS